MRKSYPNGIVLCLLLPLLAGFLPPESSLEQVFRRINNEVISHSQAYETLREATATIGHRLTGSANGRRAEEFTYHRFRQYGYKQVNYMPFQVESWSRDTVTLEVVPSRSDNFRQVRAVSLAHSPVKADLQGQIVDVGNGLAEDFERMKDQVKGKIALMNIGIAPADSGKKNLHRSEKTALAIQYGATGVIIINQVPKYVLLTGTASVTGQLIPVPAVCIGLEDGQMIREWLQEEKRLEAHISMKNKSQVIQARNVVATLKGSEKANETILIGGHLDSWDLATGAIDNGIGSCTVLEIARVFKALKLKPKRTIQFVMFMGEEQGLLGSSAMIEKLVKNRTIGKIRYMINLDMAGNPSGFNVSGREEMIPFFEETGRVIQQIDSTYKNAIGNEAGLHSDHQSFMLEGIPVTEPVSNLDPVIYQCYHADCDNFKLVNKTHLDNSVRYTAMLLYALANADQLPAQKLTSDQTRQFLEKNNLKNELVIGQKWRW